MDDDRPPRAVRVNSWSWDSGPSERRPRVPWLGIFLLVFGGLLLLQEAVPGARAASSAFFLAIGVAFLLSWAIGRGGFALYAGAIVTGYELPKVLVDLGTIQGPGWSTLGVGVAFLFLALVGQRRNGHVGWQFVIGAILAGFGAIEIAAARVPGMPDVGALVWPLFLLVAGAWLILRSTSPRRGGPIR